MSETVGPTARAAEVRPDRVIGHLRELAALTGGPDGARRLCWTPEWQKARDWLRAKLAELPCTIEIDQAGNLWATLAGQTPDVVVVGSHIDSVPHGGWLDGCLGITSALEMLRLYAQTPPPATLRLVDWADEEGARFGRSLFGSSATAGTLDPDSVRELKDREGIALPDALACAARFALEVRESAKRRGGVATCGVITVEPGIVTAIPGTCTITLDQRCLDADALAGMLADAREAAERIAADEGCTVTWDHIWRIEPIPFHPTLIRFAEESCREVAGVAHALPSGALHDAAEMARRVPTVMMFVTSIGGVSHSPAEDTPIEHLELLVRAHAGLTRRTLDRVAAGRLA